jgi:hypothetical protein
MIAPLLLAATILLPDGSPADGATAVALAKEHFAHVTGTSFVQPTEPILVAQDGTLEVTAETAGRWIILHEQGYADATILPDTAEVRLDPWCDISGFVEAPHSPGALVSYHRTERPRHTDDDRGRVFWTSSAPIQEGGGFSIRHVPRGHGSVGLQREEKNNRRIQRWRDYVRFVNVPSPGPANLAGGVPVSGRILAEDLPAIITLASKGPEPTCHGMTDLEGHFSIPGVLPGNYRLSARPDFGSATTNIPHRDITVGTEPLDLGELNGTGPDVEIDRRVEFDDGLLERIRAAAANHSDRPIEHIWIGELTHPMGNYGARVTFARTIDPEDPTRATQPELLLDIPGEFFRKFYPEIDTLGFGYWYCDAPFANERLLERKQRTFVLETTTLFVPLEEDDQYETILSLLKAIEENTLEFPAEEKKHPGSWGGRTFGGIPPTLEDLQNLSWIRFEKNGKINLWTREAPFSGKTFDFEKTENGKFRFLGGGGWVS